MKLELWILSVILCVYSSLGKDPLKVALYYESYCPACNDFIKNQLVQDWQEFQGNITVDLLPFGNADQTYVQDHWEFSCQHGVKECVGNKLHACAIYQACDGRESSDCARNSVTKVLKYITCVEAAEDQQKASNKCAKKAGLDAKDIATCASGDKGSTLLNHYGNRTVEAPSHLRHVPWVTIDGVHNEEAENDLKQVICKLRPELCTRTYTPRDQRLQRTPSSALEFQLKSGLPMAVIT